MMESMTRFSRGIGRHPMPIPHSEDSETDEYNVIDSDRQYERIGDRGSSSTGTSSSRSSNHNGALVDPLILTQGSHHHLHNVHLFNNHSKSTLNNNNNNGNGLMKTQPHHVPLTAGHPAHYAESAIYRRSRPGPTTAPNMDNEPPPLIPESQLFISGHNANNNQSVNPLMDHPSGWKSQHSTLEFGHLNQLHPHAASQQPLIQNTTILSNLDSTTNTSNATTTTSVHPGANLGAPVYESACLMRTASGSLYIPSG